MAERDCVCAKCGKEGKTLRPPERPVWCPDCLPTTLKPGQVLATCRVCGAKGIEEPWDPFPGICPDCLESDLKEDLRRLEGVA